MKISLAGVRHSQGGQSYVTNGIVLDMTSYSRVLHLNSSTRIITVESGATWEHVQAAANQVNLAVEVMQSSNIFTLLHHEGYSSMNRKQLVNTII